MRRSATSEPLHHSAKESAEQATTLHKEGKHAEAEAKAKEGLKRLGLAK